MLSCTVREHQSRQPFVYLRAPADEPMREAPPEANLCWRELAIVAKALADGRDMTEIGLMRDIALRTIAVLRDAGRI